MIKFNLFFDFKDLAVKKPYRGDYQPDYDKWAKIGKNESKIKFIPMFIYVYIAFIVMFSAASYFLDIPIEWSKFSYKKHMFLNYQYWLLCFIATIFYKATNLINNYNASEWRAKAELDAENRYQQDLDRWYHYLNAEDEIEDRKLARELKRKRAFNELDNESLIYQYSQLQAIQYQTNQQAVEFFQQAQQALRYDRKSDLDYSLDQLERALGV